jgi:hypothetical protein
MLCNFPLHMRTLKKDNFALYEAIKDAKNTVYVLYIVQCGKAPLQCLRAATR